MKILKKSNSFKIKKIIKIKKNIFIKNIKLIFEQILKKKKYKWIIICHALTGSHHFSNIFKKNLKNLGWWNKIINKIFLKFNFNFICFNNIMSNFGSTNYYSLDPLKNKNYKNNFPNIDIKNIIKIQKYILKKKKIININIIIGGSYGGIQVLIWGLMFPNFVFNCICIASIDKMNLENIIKNKINKLLINYLENILEKKFYNYNIKCIKNLKLTRIINNLYYLSNYDIKNKIFIKNFNKNYNLYKYKQKISKYFYFKSNKFYNNFNIKSYLFLIKLINKFKINFFKNKNIKFKNFLIIYFKNDKRFLYKNSKYLIKFIIKKNNYINFKNLKIKSGHDSFLIKNSFYINILNLYIKKYISER